MHVRVRNRYFDLLRAVAIVRVVLYHATGWASVTLLFPAMGVMFALAGSLMAGSLDRYGTRAVWRRLRRLLPPLWLVAVIFVPIMVITGLRPDWRLAFWLFPISDPPMRGWGQEIFGLIWYVREYLFFVLISPLALPLFRRAPLLTLAVPVVVLVAIQLGLPSWAILSDFALYFGAWLIGFAHHDGLLRRLPRWALLAAAATASSAGAAWIFTHPGPRGYDINDIPVGAFLWSTGFVVVLIGLAPAAVPWLDRYRLPSRLVTVLNSRAMTVYLWHQAVIVGVGVLIGELAWDPGRTDGMLLRLVGIPTGVAVAIVAVGWVEDLAGRRRIQLVPAGPAPAIPRQRRPVAVEARV